MNNPYEPPPDEMSVKPEKPFELFKVDLAKYSWRSPLYGLLIFIGVNILATPLEYGALLVVGAAFLFVACIAAGFVLSFVGIILSRNYAGVAAHAICGLILNSLFAITLFGLLYAISIPRKIAVNDHKYQIIQK